MPAPGRKRKLSKKIEKKSYLNAQFRKIPAEKLQNALELIKDPTHKIWDDRNTSCFASIHTVENPTPSFGLADYVKYARTCLLRRDWPNLAKILALANPSGPRSNSSLFPVFVKYAGICLSHADRSLLTSFCNSVVCSGDYNKMVELCTTYPPVQDSLG